MSARVARQFQLVYEINGACEALTRVTLAIHRQTGKEKVGEFFAHQAMHAILGKVPLVDLPYQKYLAPEAKEADYFKKWGEQLASL